MSNDDGNNRDPRPVGDEVDNRPDPFQTLVLRLRANDPSAITELYRERYHSLWRVATRIVQSSAVAEEILHDVFFGLWERRATLRLTDDVHAYLYASVRNRALNYVQHDRIVAASEIAIQQQLVHSPVVGRIGPTPDELMDTEEFYRAYRRTLAALSERERTALQLRWEDELSLDQIATILGMSIEGVRRLIARVQKKIQGILSDFQR